MKLEINEEQIAYIKGLTSKKKQRKFLLNCMIEQIEKIEIEKVSDLLITVYPEVPPFYLDEAIEFSQSAKSNYSQEEIELVKSNIAERKVTEQASELLKFDQIDKEEEFTKQDLEKAFESARIEKFHTGEFKFDIDNAEFTSFDDYYKTLNNK